MEMEILSDMSPEARQKFKRRAALMLNLSHDMFSLIKEKSFFDQRAFIIKVGLDQINDLAEKHCAFRLSKPRLDALCAGFVSTVGEEGPSTCGVFAFTHVAYHIIYDEDIPRL